MQTKQCKKCKKFQPVKSYFKDIRGKPVLRCRECIYKNARKNYSAEKSRSYKYKRLFGLSLEDFNKLHIEQGGLCAICLQKPLTHFKGKPMLNLDHDHRTNKIRGLLCKPCNMLLGEAKDKISVLLSAIKYLKKHNTCQDTQS